MESIQEQDQIFYLKEVLQICEQAMLQRSPIPNQLSHTDITTLHQAFQILQENLSSRAQDILGLTSTPTRLHQDHLHHQDHHHQLLTPKSFPSPRIPTTSSTSPRVLRKAPPPILREYTGRPHAINASVLTPVHTESHPTLNDSEGWDNRDSADPDFATLVQRSYHPTR
ncbi:hypothetical protein NLI96_g4476 [Meripilus lineatus]|uniref:Uncharacterized protein n=1 Tax=Meripilus lineatus TaxID=2056292 RepID=A0AAD5V9W4_9APHY|nr:hypothetical protein NLI96_g4476 [Physisporinus lineatus]